MPFTARTVDGPLSDVISAVWAARSEPTDGARVETRLPTGTAQLIVDVATGRTWLQGPDTGPRPLSRGADEDLVGVAFRAGGLAPFVDGPVLELRDRGVGLDDVWRRDRVDALLDGLGAARSAAERLDRLVGAFGVARQRDGLVAATLRAARDRRFRVGAWATAVGVSERHLVARFAAATGLTPKAWARMARYQRALDGVRGGDELGAVALACGYFDQAHFNREFRAYTGVAPGEYRARTAGRPASERNHLPPIRVVDPGLEAR